MPSSLPKNIFTTIPKNSKSFREAVKGIFKFTDINLAREAKNRLIHDYIDQPKYSKACASLDDGFEDANQYTGNSHNRLKSTNLIERLNQEVRRREKIIRIFPNQTSANRLMEPFLWTYMMNGFILQENTSILINRNGKTLYSILQESGLDCSIVLFWIINEFVILFRDFYLYFIYIIYKIFS